MRVSIACLIIFMIYKVLACNNDEDCNLNGFCQSNACVCEPAWRGADCGELSLLPAIKNGGYKDSSSWGGGVLKDDSNNYHMFHATFLNNCGLNSWLQNSVIQHSVSTNPAGPFKSQGIIQGAFSHNPQPVRAPDGTYIIFHIGCGNAAPQDIKYCMPGNKGTKDKVKPASHKLANIKSNEDCWCVRGLSSNSLNGPWTDSFLFKPTGQQPYPYSTDNPTPLFNADGSLTVLFRSWHPINDSYAESWIGSASAPNWRGPYKIEPQPIFRVDNEDPFIWRNRRTGHYHCLFHSMVRYTKVGTHAFSRDGKNWTFSKTSAYDSLVQFDDGSQVNFVRRERPQIYFDPNSGAPLFLYNGVQEKWETDRVFTLAQPIKN